MPSPHSLHPSRHCAAQLLGPNSSSPQGRSGPVLHWSCCLASAAGLPHIPGRAQEPQERGQGRVCPLLRLAACELEGQSLRPGGLGGPGCAVGCASVLQVGTHRSWGHKEAEVGLKQEWAVGTSCFSCIRAVAGMPGDSAVDTVKVEVPRKMVDASKSIEAVHEDIRVLSEDAIRTATEKPLGELWK
ncbi:thymidylate kinase isoform X3 [Hylobates moloch]|uniref:thymidylate kinase isoform X3 n=1 Tax=Hylobates moloch TaxID=81572 RepID=UPI0026768B85|nr:thymidylate kinase isoform X3 [Hylobates moloch]